MCGSLELDMPDLPVDATGPDNPQYRDRVARLEKWMNLLQLEGEAREEFRVEGIIASCRSEAQRLFRDFQRRIQELERGAQPG